MKKTLEQLVLSLVLTYLLLKQGHSELIVYPRDTEALVNHSTYFNCSTSTFSEQIHWYHYRVGDNRTNYVYYKGLINKIYADRYSIAIDTVTGEYNLIVRSVQPGDAGRYVCQDDGGHGSLSSAELIVLDSSPICQSSMKPEGLVGPNSCDLPIDELHLSCSVSYSGNIPPTLQWKMDGGDDTPILKGIASDYSEKRMTMNLTMISEIEMDRAFFTCSNTRSHDKQYSCTTGPVKINSASEDTTKTVLIAILIPTVVVLLIATCVLVFIIRRSKRVTDEANREGTRQKNQGPTDNALLDIANEMQPLLVDNSSIIQNRIKEEEIMTKASRAIAGVAVLDDLIYVVSDNSSEVETFDSKTVELKNLCNLDELENPWDLISCKLNKCLYIMDISSITKPKHVIRFDSDVKTLDRWSTGEEYGNLSVTSDGNVVITVCDKNILLIHRPNGTRIDVVFLSMDVIHPSHALKLSNGQFVISYGLNKDDNHRVSILSEKGELMNSSFERMETPSYMAVDETGLVFVADQGNNRVCVLNSELELIGEVASKKNGLRSPQRICLDGKTGKLFLVDNEVLEFKRRYGRLLVYSYDL